MHMKIFNKILFFGLIYVIGSSAYLFTAEVTEAQKEMLKNLPPDQRDSIMAKMDRANELTEELDAVFKEESTLIEKPEKEIPDLNEIRCQDCIYGYDFFKYSPSTFVQSSTSPVPSDYLLGPGDKLIISYFGTRVATEENYIERNGNIFLPEIGPVNLAGMTYREASDFLEKKVQSTLIGTNISISLSNINL